MNYINSRLLVYSVQEEFGKSSQLSRRRLALFVQSKVVLPEMLNLFLEHSFVLLLLWKHKQRRLLQITAEC